MKFLIIFSLLFGFVSCKPETDLTVTDTGGSNGGVDEPTVDDIPEGSDNTYIESVLAFQEHVHPVLRNYCIECHNSNAETPASPYFADAKIARSHDSIISQGKVNIAKIDNSRLHLRSAADKHNCESFGCPEVAQNILEALKKWEPKLDKRSFKPQGVVSALMKISSSTEDITTRLDPEDERELTGKKVELTYTQASLKDITISLEIYEDTDKESETYFPRYFIKNVTISTGNKPIAYSGLRVHINESFEVSANSLVELTGVVLNNTTEEDISNGIGGTDFTQTLKKPEEGGLSEDSIQVSFERLQVFE